MHNPTGDYFPLEIGTLVRQGDFADVVWRTE